MMIRHSKKRRPCIAPCSRAGHSWETYGHLVGGVDVIKAPTIIGRPGRNTLWEHVYVGVQTFADQTFAGRRFPTNICRSDKCRPWHLLTKIFAHHLLVSHLLIWQLPIQTFSENDICRPTIFRFDFCPPWQLPTVTVNDPPWHLPTVTFADRDICRPGQLQPSIRIIHQWSFFEANSVFYGVKSPFYFLRKT